jgi:hypothetical protein
MIASGRQRQDAPNSLGQPASKALGHAGYDVDVVRLGYDRNSLEFMEVSDEPSGAAEGRYEEVVDQLDCHGLLCYRLSAKVQAQPKTRRSRRQRSLR